MKKKKKLLWLQAACFPVNIGICGSKEAWDDLMRRMDDCNEPYPSDSVGRCSRFSKPGKQDTIILTFDTKALRKATPWQAVGLVTHECVHAWQYTKAAMDEPAPGVEVEAYAIQCYTQDTLNALQDMGIIKL